MRRFALTPAAADDLAEIFDFLRAENPDAARRVLQKFREAMDRLARTPGMGHLREDLADEPLKFWPVYSYLIIYRPTTHPLQVVRVLHGARDIQRLLSSEP